MYALHRGCHHLAGCVDTVNVKQVVLNVFLLAGYTDETVEDVWASAQPPYDPVPFEGIDADLSHRLMIDMYCVRVLAGGSA